jgi:uncharacterized membrane protein YgdD (TMEM256/DUF423 family)
VTDRWSVAGAVAMALAVALGAFGAHGLRGHVSDEALEWWRTASQYHAWHGLGLFAVAFVAGRTTRPRAASVAGALFVAGLVLFCGSLYGMTLTGWRWLGAITPLGGTAWIAGWVLLAVAARSGR